MSTGRQDIKRNENRRTCWLMRRIATSLLSVNSANAASMVAAEVSVGGYKRSAKPPSSGNRLPSPARVHLLAKMTARRRELRTRVDHEEVLLALSVNVARPSQQQARDGILLEERSMMRMGAGQQGREEREKSETYLVSYGSYQAAVLELCEAHRRAGCKFKQRTVGRLPFHHDPSLSPGAILNRRDGRRSSQDQDPCPRLGSRRTLTAGIAREEGGRLLPRLGERSRSETTGRGLGDGLERTGGEGSVSWVHNERKSDDLGAFLSSSDVLALFADTRLFPQVKTYSENTGLLDQMEKARWMRPFVYFPPSFSLSAHTFSAQSRLRAQARHHYTTTCRSCALGRRSRSAMRPVRSLRVDRDDKSFQAVQLLQAAILRSFVSLLFTSPSR